MFARKCHETLIMRRGEPDTRGSWPVVSNLGVHSVFMRSIHLGEVLRDELDVLGVSPTELARRVKVLDNRLVLRSEIKSINSHNH